MTREQKDALISDLADRLGKSEVVYLTDINSLNSEDSSKLRRLCFQRDVKLQVVKNTLLAKAMERVEGKEYGDLVGVLKGNTGLMTAEVGSVPAKLIKEFRKKSSKPIIKGVYIEEAIFIGDENLDMLASLKTKDELVGKNVISGLKSGGNTIAGLVKTLQERES
jgi:large subunit ribosomal protein L10